MSFHVSFAFSDEPLPPARPDACPVCGPGRGIVRLLGDRVTVCPNCNGTGRPSRFMREYREKMMAKFEKASYAAGKPAQLILCAYCGKSMKKKLWRSGFVVCSDRCGVLVAKRQEY